MSSSFASQNSGIVSKSTNNPPSSPLPVQSSGNSSIGVEQRRSGGGSAGITALARSTQASPRNNQSSRKSHKNHRKPNTPRFDSDSIDEHVAMTSNGGSRRGTSITHLMNWNLAPRPQSSSLDHRIRNYRRNPTWGLGSGYHAVDKARYVNANYRFIVDPKGNYRAQAMDSDVHIPWELVLQVLASEKSQNTNCPICLSHPVAPRMAKCGHIFCFPCLIRYIASVDEKTMVSEKKPRYKKCPICWDSIYMNEVKPVRWFTGQEGETPREGGDVVLRLVMRRQGSSLAMPKDGAQSPIELDETPWHFAAEVADYARVMKGTTEYMTDQFAQEIRDLEVMEREDELMFNDEGEWTRKAVSSIKGSIESLSGPNRLVAPPIHLEPVKEPEEPPKPKRPEIQFNTSDEGVPEMYYVMHAAKSGQSTPIHRIPPDDATISDTSKVKASSTVLTLPAPTIQENRHRKHRSSNADNSQPGAPYYFYRALPHYYLSSLDIRILRMAFGSYNSFPSTILPRVENISTGHPVDDEFRKRHKYLAHLPFGCEVAFLECDWTDVVAPEILQTFSSEIEKRRRRKKDKDAKEERDRIKAEREEDEERWRQRRSVSNSAPLTEEETLALAIAQSQVSSTSPPLAASLSETLSTTSGPPSIPSTSPPGPRTVWGTLAVHSSADDHHEPHYQHRRSSSQDDSALAWQDGWDEDDMLIEGEIQAHSRYDDYLERTPGQSPMGMGKGGNKKKKAKKVTLMTNGGKRGA